MASLLSFAKKKIQQVEHVAQGAEHAVFGNGQKTPAQQPQQQVPTNRTPIAIGRQPIRNPGPPPRTTGADPVQNFITAHIITPVVGTAHAIATSPAEAGVKAAIATVTGNKTAAQNAVKQVGQRVDTAIKPYTAPPKVSVKNGKTVIAPNAALMNLATGEGGLEAVGAEDAAKEIKPPVEPKETAPKVTASKLTKTTTPKVTPPKIEKPSVQTPVAPHSPVTATDKVFRSTTSVMNKISPKLADMVTQRRDTAETLATAAKNRLKITNTLKPEEQTNLARVMNRTEQPMNDKVASAVKETRQVLNTAYYHAKNAGVPVKGFRKNYFPRIYNPKTLREGTSGFDANVQHLVRTGQAKNSADAIGQLRQYKDSRSPGPFGNLTKSRKLDLPGYAENVPAIHHYLDKAYATIAHAKVMGKNDAKLNQVFAEIQKNGGDTEQALKSYRAASGLTARNDSVDRAVRFVNNVQGTTKLGLSALGNVQQQANNVIAGGLRNTVKSAAKLPFNEADKAFVAKTGVTGEQVAHEQLFSEQGITDRAIKVPGTQKEVNLRSITAPGFEATEKANRAVGAIAGRNQARALAAKAATGDDKAMADLTRQFGITKLTKTGKLYAADEVKAARAFVERTQFRTGAQDLPAWASTPGGRVVTQFKRYPYKQTQFLKREVVDEARRGNLRPLGRLLAVGAPLGLAANAATDKIRGNNFQESGPEKALDLIGNATGANLVASLAQQLYPDSSDANAYISKAVKTLGGPTISDLTKGLSAGFSASKGKFTDAERLALSHVPIVGTPASARLLPYASSTKGNTASPANLDPNSPQAKADTKTQTAQFKKDVGSGYGLNKLPNGKYIYSIKGTTHTTDDLSTARKALAESAFKDSPDAIRTINYADGGNLVLRRSATGSVSATTKDQFQYSLDSALLTHLKTIGDTKGYISTAQDLLSNIDRQMNNTKLTDPLDKATLQNKKDTLEKQLKKYGVNTADNTNFPGASSSSSSGYSKSYSSGGSSSSKTPFVTTGFKTASSTNFHKPTGKVTVKSPSSNSSLAKLRTKKLSVPKAPKVG